MKNIKWSCPLNDNLVFVADKECVVKYSEVMNRIFKFNNSFEKRPSDKEIKHIFSDCIECIYDKKEYFGK